MAHRTNLAILGALGLCAAALVVLDGELGVPVAMLRWPVIFGVLTLGAHQLLDLWLWRLIPSIRRPVLRGTWKATLRSNWTDPTTGQQLGDIEAYVTVRQTLTSLHMRLMTTESVSRVLVADIHESAPDRFTLTGVYQSVPRAGDQRGSRIASDPHRGIIMLTLTSRRPASIQGHYFTDRDTQGQISLSGHKAACIESFQRARRLLRAAA